MDTQGGPALVPKEVAREEVNMSSQSSISPTPSEKLQRDEVKDVDDSADQSSTNTQVEQWRLAKDLKYFDLNNQAGSRRLGVTWKNLSVNVVPADERFKENVLSQFNLIQLAKDLRAKPALKTILENSSGCVRPGEMLLVLGRPGSGCTTLLKMLANKRNGYVLKTAPS